MKNEKTTFLIKIPYSTQYLYARKGSGPQMYVAKLEELNTIAKKLGVTKKEALDLLLELIKNRIKRTRKDRIQKALEQIILDPDSYFKDEV